MAVAPASDTCRHVGLSARSGYRVLRLGAGLARPSSAAARYGFMPHSRRSGLRVISSLVTFFMFLSLIVAIARRPGRHYCQRLSASPVMFLSPIEQRASTALRRLKMPVGAS